MIKITFPDGAVRASESWQLWNCPIYQQAILAKKPWLVPTANTSTSTLVLSLKMEVSKSWHGSRRCPSNLARHLSCPLVCPSSSSPFPRHSLWELTSSSKMASYYDTDTRWPKSPTEDLLVSKKMQKSSKKTSINPWGSHCKDEVGTWNSRTTSHKLELIGEHSEDEGGLTIYR